MKILVTDSETPAALAAVRSLGAAGHEVWLASRRGAFPLAAHSKHAAGRVRLPSAESQPGAFAEGLLGVVADGRFDAVLPISDATWVALAPARAEIERRAAYCAASSAALEAASDKGALLEAARAAGLEVPDGKVIDDLQAWEAARSGIAYPSVFRSRRSFVLRDGALRKPPTSIVASAQEGESEARARLSRGEPFVATRWSRGRGAGVHLFVRGGQVVAAFGHERVRETNPAGSPACAARPRLPRRDEIDRCGALLKGWGYEGAAMLEFRARDDGELGPIVEVNPRLWGSVSLAVASGFDFPLWQVMAFAGREIAGPRPRDPLPRGCRFLTAELIHLGNVIRGCPPGWSGPWPGIGETILGLVRSSGPGWWYYSQSAHDPLPGLLEPIAMLVDAIRARRRS